MTLCGRTSFYLHICTGIFHVHDRTIPEGELRFFYYFKITGSVKKQNEHDDPSMETAVFLLKSSYKAVTLIDTRPKKQKSR